MITVIRYSKRNRNSERSAGNQNKDSTTKHMSAKNTGTTDDISVGGRSYQSFGGYSAQSTMSAKEVRASLRHYIRNERDTDLIKWRTLDESVKSEDRLRDQFVFRQSREDAKTLPVSIQKFIGTLKRAVRKIMRDKGGTPFSIVRALFMYWASSTDGTLTANDLKNVMNSLGVRMTDAERAEVVEYYSSTTQKAAPTVSRSVEAQMSYMELLQDITRGEPTNIQEIGPNYFDCDDVELRYEEVGDKYSVKPPVVQEFIEATRNYIMMAMRTEGGTPHYHVRFLFQFFDHDLSNGLNSKELQNASRKKMKLAMTETQAQQIVTFYDRKSEGQMHYDVFLKDVTEGELSRPLLSFKELTAHEREETLRKLADNKFIPRPFKANANRVLEEFKLSIKQALTKKIGKQGGRFASWILGAFREYDKGLSNKVGSWEIIRDIANRLGVAINRPTALTLICSYDKNNTGEMHYLDFIKDMDMEDPHFMAHTGAQIRSGDVVGPNLFSSALAQAADTVELGNTKGTIVESKDTPTARCPVDVTRVVSRFAKAASIYAKKSALAITARDLLFGTCLRYDTHRLGHLSVEQVQQVADELRVPLAAGDLSKLVCWFDSKGTGRLLDYRSLCLQLFGSDDAISRPLSLPKLSSKKAGSALYKMTLSYDMNPCASAATDDDSASVLSVANKGNYSVIVRGSGGEKSVNEVIESVKTKSRRLEAKRGLVLREREEIMNKLAAVEASKKKLLADLATRRAAEAAAKHREDSAVLLQNMAAAAELRKKERELGRR